MTCPDDETLARWVDRTLTAAEHEALAAHLASCESCRLVASLLLPMSLTVASPRPEHDVMPHTLGRYEVVRQVGAGAMGLVYEGNDPTLHRRVALKVLRGAADESSRERLEREARAMAQLSHRNVVTVFDVGSVATRSWVAMEFIDGETLRAWWAQHPSHDERMAKLLEAGRGLAAAHEVGLVHRDFKPDNVLVDTNGRTVVTDFGLARVSTGGPPSDDARALIGTPAYMALEQLEGRGADASADQFAFCVTAVEAFANRRPFSASSWDALRLAVKSGPDAATIDEVPTRLRSVLRRGLAADPRERFVSMQDLLTALERAWKAPLVRRRRALAAAVSVVMLTVVGLIVMERRNSEARCRDVSSIDRLAVPADAPVRLTKWARDWSSLRGDLCRGVGSLDESTRSASAACLDSLTTQFSHLTTALARAELTPDQRSALLALSLPEPAGCLQASIARALPADDAALVLEVQLLRESGQMDEAVVLASARLEREGTSPELATALFYERGRTQRVLGNHDAAVADFSKSVSLAEQTRDDTARARAMVEQAAVLLLNKHAQEAAVVVLDALRPVVARTAVPTVAIDLRYLDSDLAERNGDSAKARALATEGLELARSIGDARRQLQLMMRLLDLLLSEEIDAKVLEQAEALWVRAQPLAAESPDAFAGVQESWSQFLVSTGRTAELVRIMTRQRALVERADHPTANQRLLGVLVDWQMVRVTGDETSARRALGTVPQLRLPNLEIELLTIETEARWLVSGADVAASRLDEARRDVGRDATKPLVLLVNQLRLARGEALEPMQPGDFEQPESRALANALLAVDALQRRDTSAARRFVEAVGQPAYPGQVRSQPEWAQAILLREVVRIALKDGSKHELELLKETLDAEPSAERSRLQVRSLLECHVPLDERLIRTDPRFELLAKFVCR